MKTLAQLGRQMQSVQDLDSVVKTMKGLAAVNIRQYEKSVEAIRDYDHTVEMGLQIVLYHHPELMSNAVDHPGTRSAMIALGSDQGMCGPFNTRLAQHVLEQTDHAEGQVPPEMVLAIGARAAVELDTANVPPTNVLHLPSSVSEIGRVVQDLLLRMDDWRNQQGIHHVWMIHQRPLSGASYEAHVQRLVPLDAEWLHQLGQRPWPTRMLPAFSMNWRDLFSSLIRQHLFVALYRAMAESLAAENTARLTSMQAAEKNIEEQLNELQVRYHRRRQSAITEELLDVVAGFECLSEE